jgi:cytochrome c-type biogenesis protein CcsB
MVHAAADPFARTQEFWMLRSLGVFVALWAAGSSALGASETGHAFDWKPWRSLPVQDGGRRKPLDTLARETGRMLGNRTSLTDPKTGEKLEGAAFYLAMLFDWQGWDQPSDSRAGAMAHPGMGYFAGHQADPWDRAPIIRIGSSKLREALGFGKRQRYVSPVQLDQASIKDPATGAKIPFDRWTQDLLRSKSRGFSEFEQNALELATTLRSYQDHRMGQRLYVLPVEDSPHQHWISVAELLQSDLDDQTDPTGGLRKAKEHFRKARAAYLAGSPEAFQQATAAFLATVRKFGPRLGPYPSQTTIDLEVAYNRWAPFTLAWILSAAAFLCFLPGAVARPTVVYVAGLATLIAGSVAMVAGFAMRTMISGRAPVTNLYESVVFMAFGAALFGMIFGLRGRKRHVLAAAAAVTTIPLLLADYCPSVLDPSIRPLVPVLRSNLWLAIHVITIMLSYAALALALALGNVTLGCYLVGSRKREPINTLTRFTYKTLQAGVLLLVAGTFLGAAWADYSWGRFWGWDPKEVWALITLLAYLALLHARCAGWVGNRGLAAFSVICFSLVVMAWYGVNMLGTGLHKYGLGSGGQYYVWGAVALQFLYVGIALGRSAVDVPVTATNQRESTQGASGRWEQSSGRKRLPANSESKPSRNLRPSGH